MGQPFRYDDIETLIKDKIQKEIDKLIHDWEEEGIRVEKARWGRHNIIQGKDQKLNFQKRWMPVNLL